jgi:prepilin-type N-terminal cleavage/methylation domain-containing protein
MNVLKKGFTLVELAIVVAIVGVMASVAMTRFTGLSETAEASQARMFVNQLNSGVAMYMSRTGTLPNSFTQFVATTDAALTAAGGNLAGGGTAVFPTVSIQRLGTGQNRCTVAAQTITCGAAGGTGAFSQLSVATYTFNANGGQVTAVITGRSGQQYVQ